MPSIADLFASLDLDASGFDSKLAAARIGMVTAAEDMALPLGKVKTLLKDLQSAIGPTAAIEAMAQLKLGAEGSEAAIRDVLRAIVELNNAEKANLSIQQDASARQKEIFDRDKAAAQEALRVEREMAAARDAAGREDTAREDHRLAQQKAVNDQIALFNADLQKADDARTGAAIKNSAAIVAARSQELQQMRQTATVLTEIGVVGLAAFGAVGTGLALSAKAFADFDAALTHSLSIMGDVDKTLRDQLAAAALDLSTKFDFSAKEIAASIYSIGSAGYSAQQSLAILPIVTKFAAAAFTDLDSATKLLTASQSALGLRSDDTATNLANMTRIGDVLVKADTLAAGTSKQFAEALFNVGSSARQLNVPLETTVAGLAVFARQGIVGAEAGTQLGIVLRDLSQKAITHGEAWKKLGVEVYDSSGNFRNLGDILSQLESRFKGASAEQVRYDLIQSGVQQRSLRFILTLLNMGDSLKQFEGSLKDAGGTMDSIATKNLDTFTKQFALFQHQVEAVVITLGEPLISVLKGLVAGATPGVTTIKALADEFHNLPQPVQVAIGALALGTTTIGTLGSAALITGGQLLRMAADIKTLGGATVLIEGLTASLKVLAGVLALPAFAAGVGLVGAAAVIAANKAVPISKGDLDKLGARNPTSGTFAGLGDDENANNEAFMKAAIARNAVLGDAAKLQSQFTTEIKATTKASVDWSVADQQALDAAQKRFQAAKFNVQAIDEAFALIKKARADDLISEAEYQANLTGYQKARKAALSEQTAAANAAFREQNAQFKAEAEAVNQAIKDQERYTAELKFFGVTVQDIKIDELAGKVRDLAQGLKDGKVTQEEYNAALGKFHEMISFSVADMDKVARNAAIINEQLDKQNWDAIKKGTGEEAVVMQQLADATNKWMVSLMPGALQAKAVTDAFKEMGIKSTVDLALAAERMQKDFDIIKNSGVASAQEIDRAWVKLAESQMEAGRKFSAFQLFVIAQVEEASKNSSRKILDIARQVSREMTHLADNMARQLSEGIFKLFDSSANDQIDQQIQQLNADMQAHTAAFQQAQSDAASAIEKINSDLSKSIADIVSKGQDALDKEKASYDKFVSDTNTKIQTVVTTHQKAMAQEVQAVNDGLRKQREEYDKFVRDASDSLQRLVRSHAEAQAQIRDDASRSLRDQTTDYERFVEDTNEAIRKAQTQGDLAAVADLQKSLARRAQDFDTFRSDLAAKQAADLKKDQEQQAQELADLQKSLADKKAALDEAQQAAAQQISDITKKHQEAQAQELKDLHDSLVARTAQYEQFKIDNAADTAKQIAAARAAAAAETQVVKDKLAQQLADFDSFKAEYAKKLAELEGQHKSVFDKIADLFKGMLTGFITDLGKFLLSLAFKAVLEQISSKLFKAFDISGYIPGLGGAKSPITLPSDIPPGGDGSLPKPSSLPTGGGAASAAGSFLGLSSGALSAIGIGVDVAAGITQGIQMARLINLTGEIEVTTRKIQNEITNLRADEWTRQDQLFHKLDDMWNEIRNVVSILALIGTLGGGSGDGSGPNPDLIKAIIDVVNSHPASVDGSTQSLEQNLTDLLYPGRTTSGTQVFEGLDPVIKDNTSATSNTTDAITNLNGTLQGIFGLVPQAFGQAPVTPYTSPVSSNAGESDTGVLVLGSQLAAARQASLARSPGESSPSGAYLGSQGTWSNGVFYPTPKSTLAYDYAFLNQGQRYNGMTQYSTPTQQNLNVNVYVPNPDGDVVADNFITAVQQRGVNLR